MILGHDVSNVNGPLILSNYPDAEFFIAKVSQDSTFVDKLFASNRQQARDLGRGFGGYHYGDDKAEPNPKDSVRRFVDLLGEQELGEVAALDVEEDSGDGGFDPGDHSAWVYTWGHEFKRLTGYKAKLYTSLVGIQDYGLDVPFMPEVFDLWLAYWLNNPTQPNPTPPTPPSPFEAAGFKLWQFNADVIDKNYWIGTLDEFKATGKPASPDAGYETLYWTPMQKLLNAMAAGADSHADDAFHASVSNSIILHKIARGVEQP